MRSSDKREKRINKKIKQYFVEFNSVSSGIRLLDTLYADDYTLFAPRPSDKHIRNTKWNYEKEGTNLQSLIIKVDAKDTGSAYVKANIKRYKISAYLAGLFQVPFFFTDSSNDYSVYDIDPIKPRKKFIIINSLEEGRNTLYSIGYQKKNCALVKKLPDFKKYKKYENIFYLWRSAEDLFNEPGWRFLNYIRIIEFITKKQRGGKRKAKIMYSALSTKAKKIIGENEFVGIIEKWGNPVAHGNIPNAVIPKLQHGHFKYGHFNQNTDTIKLSEIIKILIKDLLKIKNTRKRKKTKNDLKTSNKRI